MKVWTSPNTANAPTTTKFSGGGRSDLAPAFDAERVLPPVGETAMARAILPARAFFFVRCRTGLFLYEGQGSQPRNSSVIRTGMDWPFNLAR